MCNQTTRRVLVVDDDVQLSQIVCAAIRTGGVRPIAVETYGAAMVEIARGECELVLLDLALPDSGAASTIAGIRDLLARGARKIVVITGSTVTDDLRRTVLAAGASDVIAKDATGFVMRLIELVQGPKRIL